ncbi:MAG: hypothetical protein KAR00_02740 [Candidatus Pacebacteria bacterium]|nr:hypothetical protein [Candidatus Paceibacterota bacterium]
MKLSIKKAVLFFGIVLLAVLLLAMEELGFCRQFLDMGCFIPASDTVENVLFILLITLLPFSLITYRMKEEVFQSWFKFAVWYVPAMAIGYLLYPGRGPSHSFGVGGTYADTFNLMLYTFVISIFVIVSIVRILKARKRARG